MKTLGEMIRVRVITPPTRATKPGGTGYPGQTRRCLACRALFVVKQSEVYCSLSCGYWNRRGDKHPGFIKDKPTRDCAVCGKTMVLLKTIMIGKRRTCSNRCRGIYVKRRQKNKSTRIEIAMALAMDHRGWSYISQYVVPRIGIPDFFVPSRNTIIFCDGDYWHRLPHHKARDTWQTAELQKLGYKVFRFWERDILRDPDACLQIIEDTLGGSSPAVSSAV